MAGGLGILLIVLGLGIGVVGGDGVNTSVVGIALLAGFGLLVVSIAGWTGYVQPFTRFDDIDIAADGGHGHAHAPTDHSEGEQH